MQPVYAAYTAVAILLAAAGVSSSRDSVSANVSTVAKLSEPERLPKVLAPGPGVCVRTVTRIKNVTVETSEPYEVKTFTFCFPRIRCEKTRTEYAVSFKKVPKEYASHEQYCCNGWHVSLDGERCEPTCDPPCINGHCTAPDTCECPPTFGGPRCELSCPRGFWGEACDHECPCQNEASCDPATGRCTCAAGWTGVDCSEPCSGRTFGANCTQRCRCRNGASCDRVSGACTCGPGFRGPLCVERCPAGWHGASCASACRCQNGAGCHPATGECTCPSGWTGPVCANACPSGYWGPGCALRCPCYNGVDCEPTTGRCRCPPGYVGEHCEDTCPTGRWGDQCTAECDCRNGATCNSVSGQCVCRNGYSGERCELRACSDGRYGESCEHRCDCNLLNTEHCHPRTGRCTCKPGWYGAVCERSCPHHMFGRDCATECDCTNGATCDPVDGTCLCEPGFFGRRCEKPCSPGTYGFQCKQRCDCLSANGTAIEGGCDAVSGACACLPGRYGVRCQLDCPSGRFGPGCSGTCLCDNGGHCDAVTGVCSCPPGYVGDRCEHKCPPGRYGYDCTLTCVCELDNSFGCDHVTGACRCKPDWKGARCETTCGQGFYMNSTVSAAKAITTTAEVTTSKGLSSELCSGICNCKYDSFCDRDTGQCRCTRGHRGADCGNECVQGTYGFNCANRCPACRHASPGCDPVTGACRCLPGWTGTLCDRPCPAGTFGDGCSRRCTCGPAARGVGNASRLSNEVDGLSFTNVRSSDNSSNSVEVDVVGGAVLGYGIVVGGVFSSWYGDCDPITGKCTCAAGWTGSNCDQPCAEGTFGIGCLQKCACRNGGHCRTTDGVCACPPGWTGSRCSEGCLVDMWGEKCSRLCRCDPATEICLPSVGCVCRADSEAQTASVLTCKRRPAAGLVAVNNGEAGVPYFASVAGSASATADASVSPENGPGSDSGFSGRIMWPALFIIFCAAASCIILYNRRTVKRLKRELATVVYQPDVPDYNDPSHFDNPVYAMAANKASDSSNRVLICNNRNCDDLSRSSPTAIKWPKLTSTIPAKSESLESEIVVSANKHHLAKGDGASYGLDASSTAADEGSHLLCVALPKKTMYSDQKFNCLNKTCERTNQLHASDTRCAGSNIGSLNAVLDKSSESLSSVQAAAVYGIPNKTPKHGSDCQQLTNVNKLQNEAAKLQLKVRAADAVADDYEQLKTSHQPSSDIYQSIEDEKVINKEPLYWEPATMRPERVQQQHQQPPSIPSNKPSQCPRQQPRSNDFGLMDDILTSTGMPLVKDLSLNLNATACDTTNFVPNALSSKRVAPGVTDGCDSEDSIGSSSSSDNNNALPGVVDALRNSGTLAASFDFSDDNLLSPSLMPSVLTEDTQQAKAPTAANANLPNVVSSNNPFSAAISRGTGAASEPSVTESSGQPASNMASLRDERHLLDTTLPPPDFGSIVNVGATGEGQQSLTGFDYDHLDRIRPRTDLHPGYSKMSTSCANATVSAPLPVVGPFSGSSPSN